MSKILNRKTVNISYDNASTSSVQIGLNFEFKPNKLIVKSVAYDANDGAVYQIGSDMVSEGVLCSFAATPSLQALDIHFTLQQFPQNRTWRFETQAVPTGTGAGPVTNGANGVVGLVLEFLEVADK